jgi:hypothetical protein
VTSEILRLLAAMAMIESESGAKRFNADEQAFGLYHCREGALHDVNERYGTRISLNQLLTDDPTAAFVVLAYGRMYGARRPEHYARIWNGGPEGLKKHSTLQYWERCRNLMEDMK